MNFNFKLGKPNKNLFTDIHKFMSGNSIKGVEALAIDVHRNAVKSIQKKSFGHAEVRYTADGNPKNVIVSKPGDAPNTDTGNLVRSVAFERDGFSFRVGSNVKYGKHLEFGAPKINLAERPWLRPAFLKTVKNKKAILDKAMIKDLKKQFKRLGK